MIPILALILQSSSRTLKDYKIHKLYSAESVFKGSDWNYYTAADPTFGTVEYVGREEALKNNILRYNSTLDQVYMGSAHDKHTGTPHSIRMESKDIFHRGLFLFDIEHLPDSCGSWPAIWTIARQDGGLVWPVGGEIDVLEAVNGAGFNQMSLHTTPGCNMSTAVPSPINSDCNSGDGGIGCGIKSSDVRSFGPAFNRLGGGVYAMEWVDSISGGIRFWQWIRDEIPLDIIDGLPDPYTWGVPIATFPFTSTCLPEFFKAQQIIINLTFCGLWAGDVFSQDCPLDSRNKTCAEYVSDPATSLDDANFQINSIKVYQR